jgi:hypothetical protein
MGRSQFEEEFDDWLEKSSRWRICEAMKSSTVSVDEKLYHCVRAVAAQRKTSVSALVKCFLASVAGEESEFD